MKLTRFFQIFFALSIQHQLVYSTSQNEEILQESFFIKLKTIKNECETNTANLLAVIDDLQPSMNITLFYDLKEETHSLKKMVEDLNRTVGIQQQMKDYLNETVQQQQKTLQELEKTVKDQHHAIKEQNGTIEEQQSTIGQLNAIIDRLNETELKNVKGKVEDLESGFREQRLMVSQLNESRSSGKISVTLNNC